MVYRKDPNTRFEARCFPEPNSGCWIWDGVQNHFGYGILKINYRQIRAHVFSYKKFKGPIPKGKFVLHECDCPWCVNPDHLKLGTKKQNTADAIARKRFPTGTAHHQTTLTDAQVAAIRIDDRVQHVVAKEYGVCQMTISNIKRGASWKFTK